ncbi:MAG TPA: endolytic transglycosylase MltG [Alphaproteobacteria bacterium]
MRLRRVAVAALLLTGTLATVIAGFAVWLLAAFERPYAEGPAVTVVVPRGAGIDEIGQLLAASRVIEDALPFALGVRLNHMTGRLRAGEYAFPAAVSPHAAMDLLASGKTVVHRLTIPEGLTTSQVLALVAQADALGGDLARKPEEGALLPETYNYSLGDTRDALVARMEKAMQGALDAAWTARPADFPLQSARDVAILASIVEKETGVAEERPLIAGLFLNRLARGMKLQSDPTVAYGLAKQEGRPGDWLDRALTRADLAAPTPFNSYLNDGLPPTPIANPGRAALMAVVNPTRTDALYFVANGTGGHAFANTLDEHNRNVAKWRALSRSKPEAGRASPDALTPNP